MAEDNHSTGALADSKTVTLPVPGMYCEVCPITVKKALTRVSGVSKAKVIYETREAIVIFDDAKTNVDTLRKVTGDAGYPSSVKE